MRLALSEYRMDLIKGKEKIITQQKSSGLLGDNLVSGTCVSGCEVTGQKDTGQGGATATP